MSSDSTAPTMEFTEAALEQLKKSEFKDPLRINQIAWLIGQKKEVIKNNTGRTRFIGLNTRLCIELLSDNKVWECIKNLVENIQPAQLTQETRGRKKNKNKSGSKTPKDATNCLSIRYCAVPPTLDTKVIMLLEEQRYGKGRIKKSLRHERVLVYCDSIDKGFNMRIPPNNGEKQLMPDETYVYELKDLILQSEWKQNNSNYTESGIEEANTILPSINNPAALSIPYTSNKRT